MATLAQRMDAVEEKTDRLETMFAAFMERTAACKPREQPGVADSPCDVPVVGSLEPSEQRLVRICPLRMRVRERVITAGRRFHDFEWARAVTPT